MREQWIRTKSPFLSAEMTRTRKPSKTENKHTTPAKHHRKHCVPPPPLPAKAQSLGSHSCQAVGRCPNLLPGTTSEKAKWEARISTLAGSPVGTEGRSHSLQGLDVLGFSQLPSFNKSPFHLSSLNRYLSLTSNSDKENTTRGLVHIHTNCSKDGADFQLAS